MSTHTASAYSGTTQTQIDQPMLIRADYVFFGISGFVVGMIIGAFLVYLGAKASRLFGSSNF